MKSIAGILFFLCIALLTFLGLNQLWNWVDLDELLLHKTILSVAVVLAFLFCCGWIGYVFFRKNNRYKPVGKK